MSQWLQGTVLEHKLWHPTLFSLRIETPAFDFKPGQFVRLGVMQNNTLVHRAYSIVNPAGTNYIECFITAVTEGEVSPLIRDLAVGDHIQVSQPAAGFFTLEGISNADSLWMMGTGTGLGPYLSMLSSAEVWQRFKRVVLVHAVRHHQDLAYQDTMAALTDKYGERFIYQPVVSREDLPNALRGRIPALITNGTLEKQVGISIDKNAQIMLCGNPAMILDTRTLLAERGLALNMRRKPGHVTIEQYWQQ
ncbi:ferredoxin--NADP reductase [Aliidiomarina quisquiliarum]|uniref:ferredoxin--NADP reductase n=1 Tax=Aliidiomarina quisquiliarum TaxID=2938947 RepID=UPI00208EB2C6|nr:ferredoxin--NADP reductase [Aliidiomarina quisquiliarum]MCO4321059.1 ferredoxin--NADP reductase [Aliidiomarina quisquiliarum]